MRFYGTIDSLLEYSPPTKSNYFAVQENPEDKKQGDSLEDLLQEKVRCLSDILTQINRDIESRTVLSENVIYRIYQHYCYLKTKLFQLYNWEFGRSQAVEMRRVKLEKQLDTLKQEKRQEQVHCWQDIASLNKEFRGWFKQYCDLVQRVRIILSGEAKKPISKKITLIKNDVQQSPTRLK